MCREIRRRAGGIFREEALLAQESAVELTQAFVNSRAFLDNPDDILYPLDEYVGDILPYADVVLSAVNRVCTLLAEETRNISSRIAYAGNELSKLTLKVYETSYEKQNKSLQDRCLDCWDHMLKNRIGMTEKHMMQLDDWRP